MTVVDGMIGPKGANPLQLLVGGRCREAVLRDRQAVRNFSQRVEKARPPMELRYMREVADDHGLDWEYTERVLSSRDLDEWMRQGW